MANRPERGQVLAAVSPTQNDVDGCSFPVAPSPACGPSSLGSDSQIYP